MQYARPLFDAPFPTPHERCIMCRPSHPYPILLPKDKLTAERNVTSASPCRRRRDLPADPLAHSIAVPDTGFWRSPAIRRASQPCGALCIDAQLLATARRHRHSRCAHDRPGCRDGSACLLLQASLPCESLSRRPPSQVEASIPATKQPSFFSSIAVQKADVANPSFESSFLPSHFSSCRFCAQPNGFRPCTTCSDR